MNNNITSFYNGRCLDAQARELGRNGTSIQLWDCYGVSQNNQRWYIKWDPYGSYFQIRILYDARCLDADLGSIGSNGTKVQLWDCYGTGSYNQHWRWFGI
ncbi:RICIN domain-containing protein [Actinomadura scrupuli]|uniref:RICIN domain-containing protein n=1 Tax=Actinomadura scrupuli TaxID=559629 RepID=UPI003D978850